VKVNQPFSPGQKPQLACRHDTLHASCTIPKIDKYFNLLILKVIIDREDLAQRLQ
jgi:hypothetical protein